METRNRPKQKVIRGIHPKFGKWTLQSGGYPRLHKKEYRDKLLHRVIWEDIAGFPIPIGWQVHHQDFNKLNFCGCNLIALEALLHATCKYQCPYTGKFMTRSEYVRRLGIDLNAFQEDVPDWVNN